MYGNIRHSCLYRNIKEFSLITKTSYKKLEINT